LSVPELFAHAWRKGELVLRLGILEPDDPYAQGASSGFPTVYRVSLIRLPADTGNRILKAQNKG